MLLDGYWKMELTLYKQKLWFWSKVSRWGGAYTEHQINKYIICSAIIIRKMIEDEQDFWSETHKKTKKAPKYPNLQYDLPVYESAFIGDEALFSHKVLSANYSKGTRKMIEGRLICNSIIHSYTWSILYSPEKRGAVYFATASDREKMQILYYVKLDDWMDYIKYCRDKSNI